MACEDSGSKQRCLLILELALLLGSTPLLLLSESFHPYRHTVLLFGCLFTVWRLKRRIVWGFLFGKPSTGWWRWPLFRGCCAFCLGVGYVMLMEPDSLFILPRTKPALWGVIVLLYPLLSVIPQELIYRVYVFEVHKPLWKAPWQPVCISALAFGWVHIIFTGWFAVLSCLVGGGVLGLLYQARRGNPGAIWPLVLEHTLYGLSMFTVGLGQYFFRPW